MPRQARRGFWGFYGSLREHRQVTERKGRDRMPRIREVDVTDEYLRKIQSFLPIKADGTFEYVPRVFRDGPTELQPVFILKYIDGPTLLRSSDWMRGEIVKDGEQISSRVRQGEYTAQVCRLGVQGWKNYHGLHGEEIPFDPAMKCLPVDLLIELCNAITERRDLAEEERLGLG